MNKAELGKRFFEAAHEYSSEPFELHSGKLSHDFYFGGKAAADPEVLAGIAQAMTELLPADIEYLIGVPEGGTRYATALSLATGLKQVFIRVKPHRIKGLIEGDNITGKSACLVEDITTSGDSSERAVTLLEQVMQPNILYVVTALYRGDLPRGQERLLQRNIPILPVFRESEFEEYKNFE